MKIVFFGRCKLAELLTIDQDRKIKSLGQKAPAEAGVNSGRELFVEKVNITCQSLEGKGTATEWLRAVGRSMAVRSKTNQRKDDPLAFDAETITRWKKTYFKEISDEAAAEDELNTFDRREDTIRYSNRSLIIGISCGGFEQCQPLIYDSVRKQFNFQPVKLVIRGADRQITVSLYEVDESLNICTVLYGSTAVVLMIFFTTRNTL